MPNESSPQHLAHLTRKYGDKAPPWPFIKQSHAAKLLGVDLAYLQGLANNPIPAVKAQGKSGGTVWLFKRAAIEELAAKLAGP